MHSDSEAASKALGNSKPVAEKHYIKPQTAHPAVRRAMNEAASGLVKLTWQPSFAAERRATDVQRKELRKAVSA